MAVHSTLLARFAAKFIPSIESQSMQYSKNLVRQFPTCCTFLGLVFSCFLTSDLAAQTSQETTTTVGTPGFGTDWPVFLGPTGDSKSIETGIRKDWTGDNLPIVWSMPLQMSYGTCTIVRGRLLQFDAKPVSREKNVGIVYCRHSQTGTPMWKYEYEYNYADQYGYNNGPRTSPIVDGDNVYLFGVAGTLICLNLNSGEEVWKVSTNEKFGVIQNFFGVGSNPVIVGKNVIAMVGGSPGPARVDRAKGNGSAIVAFDKQTGKVAYQLSDELASYASLKVTTHQDRQWCFAFLRGGLLGFDPTNGASDFFFPWRAKIVESVNASVPVVFDDNVLISETYGPGSAVLDFTKLQNGKPEIRWQDQRQSRKKSLQTHWNTPVHHKGYIYGSSGRHTQNAELRCIEAATGKVKWSEPGLSRASLLYVDEHFVCLDEYGGLRLVAASAEGYKPVTQVQLKDGNDKPLLAYPAWAAPILSHGLLYVRGKDKLICLELISE